MIEQRFIERIATEVKVRPEHVAAAVQLLDKGATVPFLARFRKDLLGGMEEFALERIEERNVYFTALSNRRDAMIQNIAKQGRLTPELIERFAHCYDALDLEDLCLPYRRTRRPRQNLVAEQELWPLAEHLWRQVSGAQPLDVVATEFVKPERGIATAEQAMEGARGIVAERIANDPDIRKSIRARMLDKGFLVSKATKLAEEQKNKFQPFYDFREPVQSVGPQRLLTLLRGEKQGFLKVEIEIDDAAALEEMHSRFLTAPGSEFDDAMRASIEEAYRRHLRPALERDALTIARNQAEEDAIFASRDHARELLMAPPFGRKPVLGIEPAADGSAKYAVADASGSLKAQGALAARAFTEEASATKDALLALIGEYEIAGVAVTRGAASEGGREVARQIARWLREAGRGEVPAAFQNDSVAANYGASKGAREAEPELDNEVRAAWFAARRMQDPLRTLVKADPRLLGAGPAQQDVNQRALRDALDATVASCVNYVGVDLNTSDADLLRFVAGIQAATAQNIVQYRGTHGSFSSRTQLLSVDGVGQKTYEQCVGFVTIDGGGEPLDALHIHPDAYAVVRRMAAENEIDLDSLPVERAKFENLDLARYTMDVIGIRTLQDIRRELTRPFRDPRPPFRAPRFLDGIFDIAALEEGMVAEGVITNVINFGAFVDIGVQQDGLVHLSELADRFVRDPHEVVRVGDIVRVKVIKVDRATPRISLSIKAAIDRPPRRQPQGDRPRPPRRDARPPMPQGPGAGAPPQHPPRPMPGMGPQPGEGDRPRPPRPEYRPQPRQDREEGRPRPPRRDAPPPQREDRRGDRPAASGQPQRQKKGGGGPRPGNSGGQAQAAGMPTTVTFQSQNVNPLNTALAEQLAALRRESEE